MTEYMELAAAELAKIVLANEALRERAVKARQDGQDIRAAELEAEVAATSFRLAEDYIALADLARYVPPPAAFFNAASTTSALRRTLW